MWFSLFHNKTLKLKLDALRKHKTDESACFHPFTGLFKINQNKDVIFT